MARDPLLRSTDKMVQLGFGHAILLQRIIVRMNGDWPQGDNLVAVQNTDIFAFGCSL